MAGLTVLCVPQFTYYLNRSHLANLFSISIPVICLAFYWLSQVIQTKEKNNKAFYAAFIYFNYFIAISFLLHLAPLINTKMISRFVNYPRIKENFTRFPGSPDTKEAISLILKYAPDKQRIALFVDEIATVEALMETNKAHILPFNFAEATHSSPQARKDVFDAVSLLKAGDILIISHRGLHPLQNELVEKIMKDYRTNLLEKTPSEFYVFRIR